MTKPKGEVWFLASCVELYKNEKGLDGREAYNYLRKTGAVDFITRCWEGLHMTSPLYIIDSIDEYIKTHDPDANPEG
ncbi:MAG: DUF3791 domain-containing protein [Candidatus Adiutrix sp.]|jgi:hypothetical protein|nr:DUF3791 domain-containing protein [Candidatus Adiutrix sp.]